MATTEEVELARQLVDALFRADPFQPRPAGGRLPMSAVVAVARAALKEGTYFPSEGRPEALGDGALIERRGRHRFRVYERFEVGQQRYSELRHRNHFFLRGAVARYLKHYGTLGLGGLSVDPLL